MNKINVKRAEVINAVSIPGTKVNADLTLSPEKQGVKLFYSELGLHVETSRGAAIIPMGNIKYVMLED